MAQRGAASAATAQPPLSRGEIEALCAKAARGAGMAWGLAEEAGFAAGWLAVRGIDGPQALADHLSVAQGLSWQDICPTVAPGAWTARDGGMLCPVALGATLCDFSTLPEAALDEGGLVVGPVSRPVILVPFLAAMAQRLGHGVDMLWSGRRVTVAPSGGIEGALGDLTALDTARLTLRPAPSAPEDAPEAARLAGRVGSSRDTLDRLAAMALRTTVPPSEQSRADAGAGSSDND
jgi:hypothetical protein